MKSTAIGMLLGLFPPDSGTVSLFGRDPEQAVRHGRVGAMPQEGGIITRVTVRELLSFVSRTYREPLPLDRLLALAQLTELRDRRVDRLSGGQAQRVRFAMAIAGDPELIVLDEPTAALDVEARRELWASMRGFAERGRTILFSTHYLEEADEQADRVIVINWGRVAADGTSAEIKRAVAMTTVSVTVGGEAAWLGRLPGVNRMEVAGDRARLHSSDPDATVMALARAGAVRDIEVTPADLEDAFVALTATGPLAKENA
ncbi:ABC transporter ATP-binding protein [Microtetraspora sp. AC03309]|uniref:ABC transporter ATP-binding protein n=1 Tax=Microtetraspora sp. AC03309 TaxID=2779376 RepID=UPI001E36D5AC|nr:ABC transporter ATP-binding protein [Microtetraspora sp. AC03309]